MKYTRLKLNEMLKNMRMFSIFLIPAVALITGAFVPEVLAQGDLEAKIVFETNFSDEDTGIQVFTDGDPWKKIKIVDPNGELIFKIKGKGNLKNFGLTELFSESNEPNWAEMSLLEILALFPEGDYEFTGKSVEGEELEGWATLSHDLPCAPDEESLSPSEESVASAPGVTISWDPVTHMLNNGAEACSDTDEIEVETYQVIVENFTTEKEFSIFLPAMESDNEVTLPEQFVTANTIYKYEVLAIAANGNQTIAETFFCTDLAPALCAEPD